MYRLDGMSKITTTIQEINDTGELHPLVSVCMITYNHEKYIAEAIEGVLMQEVNFPIELIIVDDCSPDKTESIVNGIIKSHPNGAIIRYFRNKVNIGVSKNFLFSLSLAQGKFIALCEGDDQWISPHKLQNQVDFLENNKNFSLVCGGFVSMNHATGNETIYLKENDLNSPYGHGFVIDLKLLLSNWCIQTLTVLFRKEYLDLNEIHKKGYKYFYDMHLFYHIIKNKNGFYQSELLGKMNVLTEGLYSGRTELEKTKLLYFARKDLFQGNPKDKILKSKLFSVASQLFINKEFIKKNADLKSFELFVDMIKTLNSFNDIKHIIKCLFFPNAF